MVLIVEFDNNRLKPVKIKDKRLKETSKSVIFKIHEYLKYQKYMEAFGNNV